MDWNFSYDFYIQNLPVRADRFDKSVKNSRDLARINMLKLQKWAESLTIELNEAASTQGR